MTGPGEFLEFLAANGPMLLIGATALLTAGSLALLLQRSPVRRQRVAEMTVLGVIAWLVLACVPLPRLSLSRGFSGAAPAGVSQAPGHSPPPGGDLPPEWESTLASVVRRAGPASIGGGTAEPAKPSETSNPPAPPNAGLAGPDRVGPVGVDRPGDAAPSATADRSRRSYRSHRSYPTIVAGLIAGLYIAGAAGSAGWLLLGHLLLWRVTRGARPPEQWLAELFEGACQAVGARRARLLVVSAPQRPVACGVFRPTVLLGREDCSGPSPRHGSGLRQVLLHEAAHLRRRDPWGNALFNVAMPLLYFHPLYWLLRSEASVAREMVADDIAAGTDRTGRTAYAADLLELARARAGHRAGYRPAPLAALGIFRSPSHFYRRLHMLMHRQTRLESHCPAAWKLATGAACAAALLLASATLGVPRAAAAAGPAAPTPPVRATWTTGTAAVPASVPQKEAAATAGPVADNGPRTEPGTQPQAGRAVPAGPDDEVSRLEAGLAAARKDVDRLSRQLAQARSRGGSQTSASPRGSARRATLGHITFKYEGDGGDGAGGTVLAFDSPTKKLMWRLDVPLNAASVIQCYDNETLLIKSADGYTRLVTAEDGKVLRAWAKGVDAPAASAEHKVNPFEAPAVPPEAGKDSGKDSGQDSGNALPSASGAAPAPAPRPASAGPLSAAVGSLRPQLDLVALADRYADAIAAAAAAKVELSAVSASDQAGRAAADAKLAAAEHKARLFRSIAQAALQQAEQEAAVERKRVAAGDASFADLIDAEGRARILSLILQSESAPPPSEGQPADGRRR